VTPTDVLDAQDTAASNARKACNDAHRVILDDGSSTTYWNTGGTARDDLPFPWFTPDHTVRGGRRRQLSKGSGTPDPDGQGNANVDRVAQAQALADFADALSADRGIDAVFPTGDFNSYSQEDPMQVFYGEGYAKLASDTENEYSYSFDGRSGSLDHALANEAALAMVEGVDIWEINADETVFNQYVRPQPGGGGHRRHHRPDAGGVARLLRTPAQDGGCRHNQSDPLRVRPRQGRAEPRALTQ
jgi:hypothetical protein